MKNITKGSIVKYIESKYGSSHGWYRISWIGRHTCNLKSIFGNYIHFKGVPLTDVVEDEESWYKAWQQSDSYQCM
jgi:uncharacterized phage-associated protein